ncbi:hypothetical protein BH09MYX1_BH09MYX1_66380 [soil metagenome]
MRIGFLGPADGDLELLERAATFLLEQNVVRVVYLGSDGALDRCVIAWAHRLVGDDPTDEGAWSRAAAVAISGTSDAIDEFVTSERQRMRLRALVSLPDDNPRSFESIGDVAMVMATEGANVDEDDLTNALVVVSGEGDEASFEEHDGRYHLHPGRLRAGAGVAMLETGDDITLVVFDHAQREVLRGMILFPDTEEEPT